MTDAELRETLVCRTVGMLLHADREVVMVGLSVHGDEVTKVMVITKAEGRL